MCRRYRYNYGGSKCAKTILQCGGLGVGSIRLIGQILGDKKSLDVTDTSINSKQSRCRSANVVGKHRSSGRFTCSILNRARRGDIHFGRCSPTTFACARIYETETTDIYIYIYRLTRLQGAFCSATRCWLHTHNTRRGIFAGGEFTGRCVKLSCRMDGRGRGRA